MGWPGLNVSQIVTLLQRLCSGAHAGPDQPGRAGGITDNASDNTVQVCLIAGVVL